jgi:hypothetical protein
VLEKALQVLQSSNFHSDPGDRYHLFKLADALYLDSAVSSRQEQLAAEIDRPRRNWHWPFKEFTITISDKND